MKIPVVDFAKYDESRPETLVEIGLEVDKALSEIGFMSIINHGVDQKLVDDVFASSKFFFGQDVAEKNRLEYTSAEENFGYQELGQEALHPGAPPDLKETLTMRDAYKHVDADWPSDEFRDLLLEFYSQCFKAANRIQRVFAQIFDLDSEYFVERHGGENVTFRILHYPPLSADIDGQLGAGAHTDYGMVTLLFQDMIGGLEVFDKNAQVWVPVDPAPGAVVINTGDMTEHWTNGKYPSTLHRVQPRGGVGDRYSAVIFYDPDDEVIVDCLPSCVSESNPAKYRPISAKEHVLAKIQATHKLAKYSA